MECIVRQTLLILIVQVKVKCDGLAPNNFRIDFEHSLLVSIFALGECRFDKTTYSFALSTLMRLEIN